MRKGQIMKRKQKIPVIKGFLNLSEKNPTPIFWCPFCQIYHRHGWPEPTEHEKKFGSHRVAHCHSSSPFLSTGYCIKPFTGSELHDLSEGILKEWQKNMAKR
ncbi:hypothetical protein ES705_20505 [subsurface metagenome]